MGEVIKESVKLFMEQSEPYLKAHLEDKDLIYISAAELLSVTNEDAEEFLSQEPIHGYWNASQYARNVFESFVNDQTFFFDKLLRKRAKGG